MAFFCIHNPLFKKKKNCTNKNLIQGTHGAFQGLLPWEKTIYEATNATQFLPMIIDQTLKLCDFG